ncbi:MAG: TusE/DsrC/DsvC family sulfur relay protein [Porticoccus sp.]|nr:TusE/DsrC/DsvC family sulfur relay protein [Porticoccus sp.]MBQ0808167.1 TusE/DsrC/DsvC family sulfur relay protein [Porticoccus sp.]
MKNHLENLDAWSDLRARQLAKDEGIELTDAHWEILQVARQFYSEYGFSPSMRPLIKYIATHLDISKARSIYLMQLFPPSPARITAKIAGLPKPKNCL